MSITIKGKLTQPLLKLISNYVETNLIDLSLMEKGKYIYKDGAKFIKESKHHLIIEVE